MQPSSRNDKVLLIATCHADPTLHLIAITVTRAFLADDKPKSEIIAHTLKSPLLPLQKTVPRLLFSLAQVARNACLLWHFPLIHKQLGGPSQRQSPPLHQHSLLVVILANVPSSRRLFLYTSSIMIILSPQNANCFNAKKQPALWGRAGGGVKK